MSRTCQLQYFLFFMFYYIFRTALIARTVAISFIMYDNIRFLVTVRQTERDIS